MGFSWSGKSQGKKRGINDTCFGSSSSNDILGENRRKSFPDIIHELESFTFYIKIGALYLFMLGKSHIMMASRR